MHSPSQLEVAGNVRLSHLRRLKTGAEVFNSCVARDFKAAHTPIC